jgi:hypothetical protein
MVAAVCDAELRSHSEELLPFLSVIDFGFYELAVSASPETWSKLGFRLLDQ